MKEIANNKHNDEITYYNNGNDIYRKSKIAIFLYI